MTQQHSSASLTASPNWEALLRESAHLLTASISSPFQRIKLYPKQAAIIDDPKRFTITEATTKAGKTASHIEWFLDEAIKTGRGNFWWVATVSDTADIAFRRSQDRLRGYLDSSGNLERAVNTTHVNEGKGAASAAVFRDADKTITGWRSEQAQIDAALGLTLPAAPSTGVPSKGSYTVRSVPNWE